MSITQRIAAGFATLVVFILIVSAGAQFGNTRISDGLEQVMDESIPMLEDSYRQMTRLQSAILALYEALPAESAEVLESRRGELGRQADELLRSIDALAERFGRQAEVGALAQSLRTASARFAGLSSAILDNRQRRIEMRAHTTQAELQFLIQGDALANWTRVYSSRVSDMPRQIAVRNLNRALNTHRLHYFNYLKSSDIERFSSDFETNREELANMYQAFLALDSDAVGAELSINEIIASLYGESGMVGLHQSMYALDREIETQLAEAATLVRDALATASRLIDVANVQADAARDRAERAAGLSGVINIALSAATLVVAIAIAVLTIGAIRRPLSSFRTALQQVRDGNLRVSFDQRRRDEFGELGASLDAVVDSLKRVLGEVSEGSSRLSDVADANSEIGRRTTAAMTEQAEQLANTTAAAGEIADRVEHVRACTDDALRAVGECETRSADVTANVDQTVASIEVQARDIAGAVTLSSELARAGADVDAIVATIKEIAEQTNLLALNAAIEAARAGEQGRGFAVVADEVRKLAGRTQTSTGRIREVVENMQQQIRGVEKVMQTSYDQAQQCVGHANRSKDSLDEMNAAIAQIRSLGAQIVEAARRQREGVAEVNASLARVSAVAGETAHGAQEAAASTAELLEYAHRQKALLQRFSL